MARVVINSQIVSQVITAVIHTVGVFRRCMLDQVLMLSVSPLTLHSTVCVWSYECEGFWFIILFLSVLVENPHHTILLTHSASLLHSLPLSFFIPSISDFLFNYFYVFLATPFSPVFISASFFIFNILSLPCHLFNILAVLCMFIILSFPSPLCLY